MEAAETAGALRITQHRGDAWHRPYTNLMPHSVEATSTTSAVFSDAISLSLIKTFKKGDRPRRGGQFHFGPLGPRLMAYVVHLGRNI